MKTLSFPQLLFASIGALLVWAAIKGQTPAGVVADAFAKTKPADGGTNPTKTGQASKDGSTGHNWDMGAGQVGGK